MARANPEGMTAQEIADRSELAGWLRRASFPAVREMLLAHVIDAGAPGAVVEQVRLLPAGREFTNTGHVWRTLHSYDRGHHAQTHRL
jgi:Protein of unknown function (DUF2795)